MPEGKGWILDIPAAGQNWPSALRTWKGAFENLADFKCKRYRDSCTSDLVEIII